ncbi:thermonuclease family protein [Porphyrobacter sp. GA68]|jgi:endonuclease YncB( thermonuclease family)|uniref:thermonuclease family protein n=2 Tax=Erythrobacteraceae TaxID=335929 RepID=UPI001D1909CB|nr:thermonuclease family protein [Porphyrobacter sp. GA68]
MKEGGMSKRTLRDNVFAFRTGRDRSKRARGRSLAVLVGGGLIVGILGGLAGIYWPFGSASAEARTTHSFAVCGMVRRTCVVDGDTIWLEGVKIRIADIDTPEISQPKCDYEYDLGIKARDRLVVLLNQGEFEAVTIGSRDEDQYGRKLRVLLRNGRSIGDQLVAEGLARTWSGRREPWC